MWTNKRKNKLWSAIHVEIDWREEYETLRDSILSNLDQSSQTHQFEENLKELSNSTTHKDWKFIEIKNT